jgi:hypothetical protein
VRKAKVMQFFGDTLDYSNFKNTIAKTADQVEKLIVYERLWHMLLDKFGGYGKIAGQQRIVTNIHKIGGARFVAASSS